MTRCMFELIVGGYTPGSDAAAMFGCCHVVESKCCAYYVGQLFVVNKYSALTMFRAGPLNFQSLSLSQTPLTVLFITLLTIILSFTFSMIQATEGATVTTHQYQGLETSLRLEPLNLFFLFLHSHLRHQLQNHLDAPNDHPIGHHHHLDSDTSQTTLIRLTTQNGYLDAPNHLEMAVAAGSRDTTRFKPQVRFSFVLFLLFTQQMITYYYRQVGRESQQELETYKNFYFRQWANHH